MTSDGLIIQLSGHRFGFSTYLLEFLVFCIKHPLFAFFTLKTRNNSRMGPPHLSAKDEYKSCPLWLVLWFFDCCAIGCNRSNSKFPKEMSSGRDIKILYVPERQTQILCFFVLDKDRRF